MVQHAPARRRTIRRTAATTRVSPRSTQQHSRRTLIATRTRDFLAHPYWTQTIALAESLAAQAWSDVLRRDRISDRTVTHALAALSGGMRQLAAKQIREAHDATTKLLGDRGPLDFAALALDDLRRLAPPTPALAALVCILEGQVVRAELAVMQYDAARGLIAAHERQRRRGDPQPSGQEASKTWDDVTRETYASLNAARGKPEWRRMREKRVTWEDWRDSLLWTTRALADLEAGRDATFTTSRAFRCALECAAKNAEHLASYQAEHRTYRTKAGKARAAIFEPAYKEVRNAASALRAGHPRWSLKRTAEELAKNRSRLPRLLNGVSAHRLRRIIAVQA